MMILFWILISLFVLIAIALVVWPLLRARESFWLVVTVMVLIPVFAVGFYWKIGDHRGLFHYWALVRNARLAKAELSKIKNPQVIVNRLIAHLKQHPDSPRGWYLLGRLYLGQRDYPKAFHALGLAYHLQPKNSEYAVSFAQASFFLHDNRLPPDTHALLEEVVKHEPNNVAAVNLLAVNAYATHHYRQAVQYWEKLIPLFVVGSRDRKVVLRMIAQAQKRDHSH